MMSKLKSDGLLLGAHVYFMLPVLIFVLFWLKLYLAIPLGALIIWGIYCTFRDEEPLWKPEFDREFFIKLAVILGLITLWVLSSGTGASVAQFPDHYIRNEIFRILVDYDWPVRAETEGVGVRGLNYYIGFWLPAALVAKAWGYQIGLLFMQIWSVIGIFFVWMFLCEKQKAVRIWFFAVFVFFGGMDAVGKWLCGDLYTQPGNSHEWWSIFYNYPGMTSHLFWAYNQAIYGWLIYCLIDRQTNNRNLLFIWCASLLTCTFPAVGMIPFVVYRALRNTDDGKPIERIKQGLKGCVTIVNGVGLVISLIMVSYLLANAVLIDTLPKVFSQEVSYAAQEQPEATAPPGGTQQDQNAETQQDPTGETQQDPNGETQQDSTGQSQEELQVTLDENGNPVIVDSEGNVVDESSGFTVEKQEDPKGEFKAWPKTTRMWMYLWFILLEVGVIFILIYRNQRNNPLFWIALAVLLICPLIKVGYGLDFCERASIPAQICLCEMVITSLRNYREEKHYVLAGMLIVVLLIGSLTTFDTIRATMAQTAGTVENLVGQGSEVVPQVEGEYVVFGGGSNFAANMDTFFYRYLAR